MPKKKIIHVQDVTERDIISLYEETLPLLDNPSKNNAGKKLSDHLKKFVTFDIRFYAMDDPKEKTRLVDSVILDLSGVNSIFMSPSKGADPKISFEKKIELIYKEMIKMRENLYPKKPKQYHYHKIISNTEPKIVLGLIRHKNTAQDNSFSKKDIETLDMLSPHIFLLYRIIINEAIRSPSLQYLTVLGNICSEIAKNYELSGTECKLIPEILYGLTNEEIAKKIFISIDTVKSHMKHIFKKTGTKNRIDFISKFFTSPESVKL
jgi:DNA-binding CsgD family transcriptional regulator